MNVDFEQGARIALALRANGMPERELVKMMGVKEASLRTAIANRGKSPVADRVRDAALRLFQSGFSQKDTAKILGVSQATAHRIFHDRPASVREPVELVWTLARVIRARRLLKHGHGAARIARELNSELPGALITGGHVEAKFRDEGFSQLRRRAA